MSRKILLSTAILTLSFSLIGCGGGAEVPDLGTVSGTVTVDGNPMEGVIVTFQPVAGGRSSMGSTDSNGYYTLSYTAEAQGALIGKHKVMVTSQSTSDAPDPSGVEKDTIPPHYNTKTTLEKEVKAGDNTIDLELFM